jgi:hypothetical protein
MLAAYLHSMRESVNKRMALVLIGMALLFTVIFFFIFQIRPLQPKNLSMILMGGHMLGPATLAVPAAMSAEIQQTGALWLLLGIFGATPLFVSAMEKGWVELTFTKGTGRWRLLLGVYFSGLTVYATALLVALVPTAIWLWARTGVGCKPLLFAILLEVLGFASLMALAALCSLPRTGASIPIMAAVLVFILSPLLAERKNTFYLLFTSNWSRAIVDWSYRILPKPSEITGAAIKYTQMGSIGSWFPIWSTGVFIIVTMGLTIWLLHRKSF